jgi:hypothetical protein
VRLKKEQGDCRGQGGLHLRRDSGTREGRSTRENKGDNRREERKGCVYQGGDGDRGKVGGNGSRKGRREGWGMVKEYGR